MRIRRRPDGKWAQLTIDWTQSHVTIDGTPYNLREGDHHRCEHLAHLATALDAEGIEIECCASCQYLHLSGFAYDGGWAGYCGRVGPKKPVVGADTGCGERRSLPIWKDLMAAQSERWRLVRANPAPSRLNAFAGSLVGLAVGDALGYPAEFRTRQQILETYGPAGLTDFVGVRDPAWPRRPMIIGEPHPPGTYTDDTQMSLAVAEALIEAGHEGPNRCMQRIAERWVAWSESPDNNRAPGETCMTGCQKLAAGVPWSDSGNPNSKGCGSAMRVAPIGLYFWHDEAQLLDLARKSSIATHGHDAGIEGAAAAALLVQLALRKTPPRKMYEALMAECAPRSPDFRRALQKVPDRLGDDPADVLSEQGLGEGWVAEEAVASALYCFWRSPDDFEETVLTAVNTDGDSDSIACIAGSISGAFNGLDAIPQPWRAGVENAEYLLQTAERLWLQVKPA